MTSPIHVWGYATGCPACTNIKTLFSLLNIDHTFHAIEPDSRERNLLREAGFSTVPQVFTLDGEHLGDWSTFRQAASAAVTI